MRRSKWLLLFGALAALAALPASPPNVPVSYTPGIPQALADQGAAAPGYNAIYHEAEVAHPNAHLPEMLKRIRGCESHGDPHARGDYHAQNKHSTASGAFQYLDSTWANHRGYRKARYAPRWVQDKRALRDFRGQQLHYPYNGPWHASRYCWRR